MSPLELALEYMRIFFSGAGYERLEALFADDLVFEGPFFTFDSARAYIASLTESPCIDCRYTLVEAFEKGESVNLIYRFHKGDVSTLMSQLFTICDGRIARILLIFDSMVFDDAQ